MINGMKLIVNLVIQVNIILNNYLYGMVNETKIIVVMVIQVNIIIK